MALGSYSILKWNHFSCAIRHLISRIRTELEELVCGNQTRGFSQTDGGRDPGAMAICQRLALEDLLSQDLNHGAVRNVPIAHVGCTCS